MTTYLLVAHEITCSSTCGEKLRESHDFSPLAPCEGACNGEDRHLLRRATVWKKTVKRSRITTPERGLIDNRSISIQKGAGTRTVVL
jgi:hypothetical protein